MTAPCEERAWLAYQTAEPIPLDEGNAAYDKRVRMLKHAFISGYRVGQSLIDATKTEKG